MQQPDIEFDDSRPFDSYKISEDWMKLNSVNERSICEKCGKSRKYFCYTCYLAVAEIKDIVPNVKLPLKVDIIKHCREIDGKSTAIHAAIICPEDVNIYTYPTIPNYEAFERVVLVFPNPAAISVESSVQKMVSEYNLDINNELPFERVVLIDSTWNQCKGIYKDPRLFKLPCITLKNRITQFWRHQNGSPRWYLSTIEAIHQFLIEFQTAVFMLKQSIGNSANANESLNSVKNSNDETCERSHLGNCYNGEYDNLLFFFCFMYSKIHTLYSHQSLRSYKRPLY